MSAICPATFCATVMIVRRMKVDSMSSMSAPRKARNTSAAFSWLVLYVTEMSWRMCWPSRVGRSIASSVRDEPSFDRATIV